VIAISRIAYGFIVIAVTVVVYTDFDAAERRPSGFEIRYAESDVYRFACRDGAVIIIGITFYA
jgi:hypothetical protein